MSIILECPVCRSSEVSVFFEILDMPVHIGLLWPGRDAARTCPKGDIKLSFCKTCGLIWNQVFDQSRLEYSTNYDNSLHYSPVYQEYARTMARHLIERYQLYGKTIIEIGCGKGDFLIMLCEMGNNIGVGFDASYETREIDNEVAEKITFIQDIYSEKYAGYHGDLVCSRYVLEHIEKPVEFLNTVRRSIGDRPDAVVYFEVPNVCLILERLSIWDIIYEHCLYFSPGSLAYLFESCGFRVNDVSERYGNQFVGIETSAVSGGNILPYDRQDDLNKIICKVEDFIPNYQKRLEAWQTHLQRIENGDQRALIWGAGAKGVSFLNMLKIEKSIRYIVDINPNKHDKYIAGTGQKIVPPEFVRDYHPDIIIVMNPIYKEEIQKKIIDMGINTELLIA